MARKRIITGGALILTLVGVAVGLLLVPIPTKSTEQQTNGRTTDVTILKIRPAPLMEWIELPATVEPFLLTEVPAEVEGRIDWIGPKEGDFIDDPQAPILRIDQRSFRAQWEEAQAAYTLSSRNCQRFEELHNEGTVSDEQLDQCRAKVDADAARLEIAKIQIEKATVRAPVAGVLNRMYSDVGEYLKKGDRVADIVVINPAKIVINVPEKDIPYVRRGENVQVSFEFLQGKSYEGKVSYTSVVGDQATRSYRVEITVSNPELEILPSMIATVRLLKNEISDAITVPLFSVIPRGDYAVVFVEKNGKAEERPVELGILDGDRVQIVKGVNPAEHLIVDGHRELADGESVRVRDSIEASQ